MTLRVHTMAIPSRGPWGRGESGGGGAKACARHARHPSPTIYQGNAITQGVGVGNHALCRPSNEVQGAVHGDVGGSGVVCGQQGLCPLEEVIPPNVGGVGWGAHVVVILGHAMIHSTKG